ncbi:penicillin acylase [Burkholderia oklahomensis EO147]|nr:penicillin acylase [Burkholderia oklahomensis EO147]AOI45887.1 penicillin acylase [Burkholderia oklahomensis C6786]KUY52750.1 penicillin acylase [Burkholderia oklahomensis EO147]KUY52866.1 penicillin acylase [Burkholderia oklahomensis C6786]
MATTHLVSRAPRGEPSPWIPAPAAFASTVAAAFGDALESLRAAGDRPTWGRHHRLGFTHLLSAAPGRMRRAAALSPRAPGPEIDTRRCRAEQHTRLGGHAAQALRRQFHPRFCNAP